MHQQGTMAMRFVTPLVTISLAAVVAIGYFRGEQFGQRLGLIPAPADPAASPSLQFLDQLRAARIRQLKLEYPAGPPLELERTASADGWRLPGNWPIRRGEVQELLAVFDRLRSRFQPLPLEPAEGGVELPSPEKTWRVTLLLDDGTTHRLMFWEPVPPLADENPFTQTLYVRVDDHQEVVRLGPDLLPLLRRPADAYRRRAIFPDVERVRLAGAAPADPLGLPDADAALAVTLPGERTARIALRWPVPQLWGFPLGRWLHPAIVRSGPWPPAGIRVRGGDPAIHLDRLAEVWTIQEPVPDRADPARLRALLAAVAQLWVEEFLPEPPDDDKHGFAADGRAVIITPRDGEPLTLRIGGVAKTVEIEELTPLPTPPGMPPRTVPSKRRIDHRYARLEGNPQLFTISAARLDDLFASYGELSDPRAVRFLTEEVEEIVVQAADHSAAPVRLFRKRGNPNAPNFEERQDRWFLAAQPHPLLAETSRVQELLDRLAGLRADGPDSRYSAATPPPSRWQVQLTLRDKRAPGEPPAPPRTLQIRLGPPDYVRRRLPVWQADALPAAQPPARYRITLADATLPEQTPAGWLSGWLFPRTVAELFDRPALAYRSRRLFDPSAELAALELVGQFRLERFGDTWQLREPLTAAADPAQATDLARELLQLQAGEYLTDQPPPEQLRQFGLDRPELTLRLHLRGGPTSTLQIGQSRPGTLEVYARLDDGAVFTLPETLRERLRSGAAPLLPLTLWDVPPEHILRLEIVRRDQPAASFTLEREGTNWKLTGPFTATVLFLNAQPLLTTLGKLTASKYHALTVPQPAEFGLDAPQILVRLRYRDPKAGLAETVRTLQIGKAADASGDAFARLDEPHAPVFRLPASYLQAARTSPLQLLDKSLLTLDTERLTEITVQGPPGTFTLRKGPSWTLAGADFPLDATRIDELLQVLGRLSAESIVAYGEGTAWAEYGLQPPQWTLRLRLSGEPPREHTVAVGKVAPGGGRYVRVDNGPAVGLVPASAAAPLLYGRFDYAERTLLQFPPAAWTRFLRRQGKETLEIVPTSTGTWDIRQPLQQRADGPLLEELAATLGQLKAERVADYGPRGEMYARYGLEPAAATVEVQAAGRTQVLRIGKPVQEGRPERYAAVEGASPQVLVGVLPARLAETLLAPPLAFRDRTVAPFGSADHVTVEQPGRKVTFARTAGRWEMVEPLAAAAEAAELESLVSDLARLRVLRWVADKPKDLSRYGLDPPLAVWTLRSGDKVVLTLQLGAATAENRRYVTTPQSPYIGELDAEWSRRLLAEYRRRKPWDLDAAQAEALELRRGGRTLRLRRDGTDWKDAQDPAAPLDAAAVNDLLATLDGLQVERYVADQKSPPQLFGLDSPEMTVEVRAAGRRYVLEIGGPVGGSDGRQRYVRVAGSDAVGVLRPTDTERLLRDLDSYRPPKKK